MHRRTLLSLNFFPNFLPPRTGGEQRSFFLLKALAKEFDIISVVPTYENMRFEDLTLAPGLREIRIPKSRHFSAVSANFQKKKIPIHQTAMAYAIAGANQPEIINCLQDIWPKIDGVILQHAAASAVLDSVNLDNKPTFYVSMNCEFELAANSHKNTENHDFAIMMHQFEYRTCLNSQLVVSTTNEDSEKFVHMFGVSRDDTYLAGNGSVCRFEEDKLPSDAVDAKSAIFLGSKWGPNLKAGRFICSTLAPACPEITFHICGNVCEKLDFSETPENVILHGVVDDAGLAKLMARSHIGLNPILDGAGSNVKLADYLAHGLRVVTTPKGARGFETDLDNVHCMEPGDFAAALTELCAQHAPTSTTRAAWQKAAAPWWSWDHIGEGLTKRIAQCLSSNQSATKPPARRIVVMNEFPIKGRESGGEARISGLLSQPPEGTEVVIVSFGRGDFKLHKLSERVACIELPAITWQKGQVAEANRYNYTSVDDVVYPQTVHRNPMFLAALDCMVAHADAVVLEHPFMLEVYRQLRSRAPVIYGSHNVEADMKLVTLDAHRRKNHFCDIIRDWEQKTVSHAQLVCACSEQDAEVYRKWGARRVEVLENGVTPLSQQIGKDVFEEDRCIYLRREFADLPVEHAGHIIEMILKRPPLPQEIVAASRAHKVGGPTLDRYLLELIRCPENLQGPRSYVTGLLTTEAKRPFSAVFLGTSHRPNLSAAELLINFVAPASPETDFLLVGKVGASLGNRELPDNVFVVGFVSDDLKTALMLDCDIGLNPMTEGGGSNLKIPDYLAHGLCVLSTFFGSRGFRFTPDEGLHQADILNFSAKINELNANKGKVRTRIPTDGARIKEYYWSTLSRRYFDLIAKAAGFETVRDTSLVQSAISLDPSLLSFEAAPLAEDIQKGSDHILVQAPPLMRPSENPIYSELVPGRISYFEYRRELYAELDNIPSFGLLNKRLMRQGTSLRRDFEQPHRLPEQVQFIRHFSAPLYNGRQVHRFIADGAQLLLPEDCKTLYMTGFSQQPMIMKTYAQGKLVARNELNKKFSISIDINDARTVEFALVGQDYFGTYGVSVEGLDIRTGQMAYKVSLLQPGSDQQRQILDGRRDTAVLQEDTLLKTMAVAARGAAGKIHFCGDEGFGKAVMAQVPKAEKFARKGAVFEDWVIGLMSNPRNRSGYTNKLNLGATPLTFVASALTSELVALIERSAGRLQHRFPAIKVMVFVPRDLAHTRAFQIFKDYLEKKKIAVLCQAPGSDRETLAIFAKSGAVLAYNVGVSQRERLNILADVFDLNIGFWGAGADTPHAPRTVVSVDMLVHAYWQRCSDTEWQPSMNFDLLQSVVPVVG